MKKILSIDFDYFIDATEKQRNSLFPSGADEVDPQELKYLWKKAYQAFPSELEGIEVIEKEYRYIKSIIRMYPLNSISIMNSHKGIKKVIDLVSMDEDIKIVNIDFHHDFYHFFNGGEEYNCGNWVRRLLEDRPKTEVTWIRREDSQVVSLEGALPFTHTTDINILDGVKFDYVFLCLSPEWTPPHLNKYFEVLTKEGF